MNREDAKYIISEIRNIQYFNDKIEELNGKIDELEDRIADATAPRSPNGGIDIIKNGVSVRYKPVSSHNGSVETKINDWITQQGSLEYWRDHFSKRLTVAQRYKDRLMKTRYSALVQDFFNVNLSYRQVESKHGIGNAYRKMVNIIMDTINDVWSV